MPRSGHLVPSFFLSFFLRDVTTARRPFGREEGIEEDRRERHENSQGVARWKNDGTNREILKIAALIETRPRYFPSVLSRVPF